MAEGQQIIIKRVKKVAAGHHGGAWKVAYADFVTAMMAFFLLLWLLNAVTEEQLTGISNYFAPSMASKSASGAGGLLGGQVIGQGAQVSQTSSPSLVQHLPPSSIGPGGEDMTSENTEPMEGMSEEDFREKMAEREQQKFDKAKEVLDNALKGIPELKQFEGSMMVDNTPEGLRIQITDQEGLAMFPSGSSAMFGHTRALLDLVSRIVNQMPNKISITGHTDAIPFRDPSGYTNWELSADRALASRRALLGSGVPEERIDRIVGRASSEPLVVDDPKAPRNRRISIILLRENDLTEPPQTPVPAASPPPAQTPAPSPANGGKKG
ncbi:flagellar motor protein MotB [Magnetospirillum gryphiswaldense]|uniref:Flagellar motor protein n=1 Tax=Magnetospirillum gryphiswaldense TaxID=55518 RepID=A4U1F9_9PROT|nr:flagellar motor protein MotB [Magnetospirillum gryphiswaldense]AVM73661.1 motility protein B1 [Magnetospirillum gryphiswaldense MSR-1]AVM77564.1 motility protein B1 [Magnetospirillum gryphiswaldense]CAM76716.1 Flagellar motor protein [Magnetospirillum gryphiswaldense MSR-1]